MERVPAESRIVFLNLQFFCLQLLVTRGGVTGRRFTFLAGLGAFDGDDFAWHDYSFSLVFSSGSSSSASTSATPTESTVPRAPSRRWRKAPSFSSWAWA